MKIRFMKIKFTKDVTVDVLDQDDTFDKFMRQGVSIDCVEVIPVSRDFSNILLSEETALIDVRNDSFERVV